MASKNDLLAEAEMLGLEVPEGASKADIQALLDKENGVEPKAQAPKQAKERRWKVKTPDADFSGMSRGVAFAEGVGETTNEWFATQCAEAGYEVEEVK